MSLSSPTLNESWIKSWAETKLPFPFQVKPLPLQFSSLSPMLSLPQEKETSSSGTPQTPKPTLKPETSLLPQNFPPISGLYTRSGFPAQRSPVRTTVADLERLNHREEQIRRMEAEKLKDEIRAIMQAQNNKTIKPTYQNTRMAQPPVTDVCIQFIGGPKNGEQEFKKNESIYGDGMTIRIIMADN